MEGYNKYPKGSKAPDALLKIAYSKAAIGENIKACHFLQKLEEEFPTRPSLSIKKAKEAQEKFHCIADDNHNN
jgi:TolA-binding protein